VVGGTNTITDLFALLDEPRRPWIDADLLKEKFLARSAQLHPDRIHQAPAAERQSADRQYSALNAAYNCLRDPGRRLQHLLELELGIKPGGVQSLPPGMMEFSIEVGRLCRKADDLLKEKDSVNSPVLKVRLFEHSQFLTDLLSALRQSINCRLGELMAELKAMNPAWEATQATTAKREGLSLERLEEIRCVLSYFSRWLEQIQERVVELSL
jgi:curved DNA-binding protein CbpA